MNSPKSNSSSERIRSNNQIRVPNVRLIGSDGNQVGVVVTYEALRMAKEQGLDLVEVNAKAYPPVCKIMDFGKFKYEQKKKEKEIQRVQRENTLGLKEISVRPTTVEHDLQIKAENYIQRWLSEGNRVRIAVVFKGREVAHPEIGAEVLKTLLECLTAGSYTTEEKPTLNGKQMTTLICPASASTVQKTA
jgi:translation initiation factor IF-3